MFPTLALFFTIWRGVGGGGYRTVERERINKYPSLEQKMPQTGN